MKIMVTGGTGYIGSHTCVELLNNGYQVVIVDNLSNSSIQVLERIQEITGKEVIFYQTDILNQAELEGIFEKENVDAVIHFAGLKAVGESVAKPLEYYHNNVTGTIVLCEAMKKFKVHNLVFSSSATVYGAPKTVPIREDFPLSTTNPYGTSKWMIELILQDLQIAQPEWNIIMLRYFNPIGAHKSGRIGEDPRGIPNNLVPYITQVAVGKRELLSVYGDDYDTVDGTGVRDYLHVVDLAIGHVRAIETLAQKKGMSIYNLGTGKGYSVLEMIEAFRAVTGQPIPYRVMERRPGDIATCYADVTKAREELHWEAERTLKEMCEDAWRWQEQNPDGYRS